MHAYSCIRGGLTARPPAFGVHDDALYKSTFFTFLLLRGCCTSALWTSEVIKGHGEVPRSDATTRS